MEKSKKNERQTVVSRHFKYTSNETEFIELQSAIKVNIELKNEMKTVQRKRTKKDREDFSKSIIQSAHLKWHNLISM